MTSRINGLFGSAKGEQEDGGHWLSVSDLMAGLMMVFLFIAITFMRNTLIENQKMKEVAVAYKETQVAIYDALSEEFEEDLEKWGAKVDRETLSFEFRSPEVLFDNGDISLKPAFQQILSNFFPRYLSRLEQFKDSIDEVRIEGHTSSGWNSHTGESEAYFKNMWLSQGRTRSVLNYVYILPAVENSRDWVKRHIAAVGFSSSRLIYKGEEEDQEGSRRVSFRVITNAEIQIRKILEG